MSGPTGRQRRPGLRSHLERKRNPSEQRNPSGLRQVTKSDQLTIELRHPPDTPAFVLLRWPEHPSVTSTDPKRARQWGALRCSRYR